MKSLLLALFILFAAQGLKAQIIFADFEEAPRQYVLTNDHFAAWQIVKNPDKKINTSDSCVMLNRQQGIGVLGGPENHYHAKISYKHLVNLGDIKTLSVYVYGKKGARLNIEWFDDHSLLDKIASSWAGDNQLIKTDNTWQLVTVDASKVSNKTIRSIRISIGSYASQQIDLENYKGIYYFDDFIYH